MLMTLVFGPLTLVAGFTPAHVLTSRAATATPFALSRAAARMSNEWPPPLDAVHVFTIGSEKGPKLKLALTQIPTAEAAALVPLWKLQYGHEPVGTMPAYRIGEVTLGTESVPFAAYLDGVESPANAIALVRFETSEEEQSKLLVIESMILSPTCPPPFRAPLLGAVTRVLCALGEAQGLTVRRLDSFDV